MSEQKTQVIEGYAHNGKPCRLIDHTGNVPPDELHTLLADLIAAQRFGFRGRSLQGGNTIALNAPEFSHIQIGETLYRLVLLPYEAHLDRF